MASLPPCPAASRHALLSVPNPPPTPPPDKRSRILFWFGCAGCLFFLLLAGIAGTFAYLFLSTGPPKSPRRQAGWHDSLRVHYALPPEIAELAPLLASDSGSGSDLGRQRWNHAAATRSAAVQRLVRSLAHQPADDSALAQVLGDTTLGAAIAASHNAWYEVLGRFSDSAGRTRLFAPAGPGPLMVGRWNANGAMGLILRGTFELRRGDRARAREDFLAALRLGRLIWRSEPEFFGLNSGYTTIHNAGWALGQLAAATRDTALQRRSAAIAAWMPFGRGQLVGYLPADTLLMAAADTALPRGLRVEMIEIACQKSIFEPIVRLLLGPKRSLHQEAQVLARDPDPVMARIGAIADSSLAALSSKGPVGRYRLLTHPPR